MDLKGQHTHIGVVEQIEIGQIIHITGVVEKTILESSLCVFVMLKLRTGCHEWVFIGNKVVG